MTTRLVCALVASLVSMGLQAQTSSVRPTLVVGILVEGLDEDYIDLLKHKFGEDGFKRLINDGVTLESVEYGSGIGPTAAAAMLMTGTTPSVSGITGDKTFDIDTRRAKPVLLDPKAIGNFTNETYSPAGLLVSTLADEIRINDDGLGIVYSLAPEPQTAIILSGHAGNSAFWINDVDGKWSTTTYYKDVPTSISRRNYSTPLSSRLDTMTWKPSISLDQYPDLPEHRKLYPFTNRFNERDRDRYRRFKASPMVNREITDVATDYIAGSKLGQRQVMDMLNVAYTVAPYPYSRDADNRIDTQDAYLRLDRDLARLFKAIDRGPGMDHTLVFLAGTPATASGKRDDDKWNIPHGEFSARKAISLLNMYLIAIHGNGDWVTGYHNKQFYLNQKLIKDRNVDIHTIRTEAADFLGRMAGVARVYTIEDIIGHRTDEADRSLRRNTSLASAGDVLVSINPGWEVTEDDQSGTPDSQVQRLGVESTPVYILAPGLKAEKIATPLDACVVAPTVARLLRIRSPNAAMMSPLRLK